MTKEFLAEIDVEAEADKRPRSNWIVTQLRAGIAVRKKARLGTVTESAAPKDLHSKAQTFHRTSGAIPASISVEDAHAKNPWPDTASFSLGEKHQEPATKSSKKRETCFYRGKKAAGGSGQKNPATCAECAAPKKGQP